MPRWIRLPIGLAAALFAGWLHHGPYGGGTRFVDALEQRAQMRLRFAELPGVSVRMQREPLARTAILSGTANQFQREGMGPIRHRRPKSPPPGNSPGSSGTNDLRAEGADADSR